MPSLGQRNFLHLEYRINCVQQSILWDPLKHSQFLDPVPSLHQDPVRLWRVRWSSSQWVSSANLDRVKIDKGSKLHKENVNLPVFYCAVWSQYTRRLLVFKACRCFLPPSQHDRPSFGYPMFYKDLWGCQWEYSRSFLELWVTIRRSLFDRHRFVFREIGEQKDDEPGDKWKCFWPNSSV